MLKLGVSEIFSKPTIRQLAKLIGKSGRCTFAPIPTAEKKEYYMVSPAQRRLYVLQQIDERGIGYNIPCTVILEGDVNQRQLEDTFTRLIERHESLRTSFAVIDDRPVQKIHDIGGIEFVIEYDNVKEVKVKVEVEEERASRLEGTRGLAPLPGELAAPPGIWQLATGRIKDFIRPFDLSQAPLLRVGLIELPRIRAAGCSHPSSTTPTTHPGKKPGKKYLLVVDMHHIICDAPSLDIFINEFMSLYNMEKLPALRIQYKDFSGWENRGEQQETIKQQEEYWLKEFAGEVPVLNLSYDYVRPLVQRFEGSTLHFEIGEDDTRTLKAYALERGSTLFMVLISIYAIFLAKLSNQEDIVIGTPVTSRKQADLEHIMGMFANTLALRLSPGGEKKFSTFLAEVKEKTLTAFMNQDYPYEDLIEITAVERDASRNPLFDTMFVLQTMETSLDTEIPGLRLKSCDYETGIAKFDQTLYGVESGEKLAFSLEYSTNLFKEETINRFISYFKRILSGVIREPAGEIRKIQLLSEEERGQVIYDFNHTEAGYPGNKMVHRIFAGQVEKAPDNIALVGPVQIKNKTYMTYTNHISYRELNEKAEPMAHLLQQQGILPDTVVGIMAVRSIEMVIGLMGILKAGGAYLPIDLDYPEDRIKYMLEDSGAKLLVTTSSLTKEDEKLKGWEGDRNLQIVILDVSTLLPFYPSTLPSSHPCLSPAPVNSLAYVIYTSGSTGKPKGVLVNHGALANILWSLYEKYPLSEIDNYLLKTSVVFDVSVVELFGWFIGGGRLTVLEANGEKDPQCILDTISRCRVTHINFVPSMFKAFMHMLNPQNTQQLSGLKYIFLAGEALWPGLVTRFKNLAAHIDIILENLYGPTEAAVYASGYSLQEWDGSGNIPIGKPLPNIKLYILDRDGRLQPIGIPGELSIGGMGLARGYLNRPDLTAERFVHDLWDSQDYQDGYHRSYMSYISKRLYKTGDLAQWLPDGNIQFLGRIDQQVKIRGFRVEPGEIENKLQSHECIKEAVVLEREDKTGDKYLCSYIVPTSIGSKEVLKSQELRNFLVEKLPEYMIPSYFVLLENIPLTPSGKIDRKSLPLPVVNADETFTPPQDETQEQLVEIWSDLLAIEKEKISIDTNFFELGGHSLKAVLMTAKIHQRFDTNLPMTDIFKKPTIRGIASVIDAFTWTDNPKINRRGKREEVVL